GDTHQASQWQVDLETGNFSSPKVNTTSTSNLTSLSVGHLTPLTAYKARVRYQDSHSNWSPYSDPAVNPDAHFMTLGPCALAPKIISVAPPAGATGVAVDVVPILIFNVPLETASVTPSTIEIFRKSAPAVSVT